MYLPSSSIIETGYTQGDRFVVLSTNTSYKGYYHKDDQERYWTGEIHTNDSLLLSNIIYDGPLDLNTIIKLNQTSYGYTQQFNTNLDTDLYKNEYITPTKEDYDRGYYTRYFAQLKASINPYIIELSQTNYNSLITSQSRIYYNTVTLLWKLIGCLDDTFNNNVRVDTGVRDTNLRSIQEASKTIKDINQTLTDPLQFAYINPCVSLIPTPTPFLGVTETKYAGNVYNVIDPFTPTPTPTATPTITPTLSPTRTPSKTPSKTPSVTPSITRTPSVTPTTTPPVSPSKTPSVTPTRTPSITPTRTPSKTPSVTPSVTRTPSITPTRTPSITPTTSITPTPTPTITPLASPSNTPSITPTRTPSVTTSPTPTKTPTTTPTPTITPTSSRPACYCYAFVPDTAGGILIGYVSYRGCDGVNYSFIPVGPAGIGICVMDGTTPSTIGLLGFPGNGIVNCTANSGICSVPPPSQSPSPTPTVTTTATPSVTPTVTPTITVTSTPTPTVTITPTITPTPSCVAPNPGSMIDKYIITQYDCGSGIVGLINQSALDICILISAYESTLCTVASYGISSPTFNIGDRVYYTGQTSCDCPPNGNYWVVDDNNNPPEYPNPQVVMTISNCIITSKLTCPVPPPSVSPTSTPSVTVTPTVTPTVTNTPTPTVTRTPSITPTGTPSNTPSGTPSNTPSSTPTPTRTPSVTPTNTPSNTPSITVTPTRTPSITVTPSNTPSVTRTPSITPTRTPSVTPTRTPSVTPTRTPSISVTPTNTPTPTVTPSPPTPCQCYLIEVLYQSTISWVDCSGNPQTQKLTKSNLYICAQVGSVNVFDVDPSFPSTVKNLGTTCTTNNDCLPPPSCNCITLTNESLGVFDVKYINCNGVEITVSISSPGTYNFCGYYFRIVEHVNDVNVDIGSACKEVTPGNFQCDSITGQPIDLYFTPTKTGNDCNLALEGVYAETLTTYYVDLSCVPIVPGCIIYTDSALTTPIVGSGYFLDGNFVYVYNSGVVTDVDPCNTITSYNFTATFCADSLNQPDACNCVGGFFSSTFLITQITGLSDPTVNGSKWAGSSDGYYKVEQTIPSGLSYQGRWVYIYGSYVLQSGTC